MNNVRRLISILFLVILILPLYAIELSQKVVARVDGEEIQEKDLRVMYSCFLNPGQKPFLDDATREVVLKEVIRFQALSHHLDTLYIPFDEKMLQSYSNQMVDDFSKSFEKRLDFLVLLNLLSVSERELPKIFFDYFSASQKLDFFAENKMRMLNKITVDRTQKVIYRILLLVAPDDCSKQTLMSYCLQHKGLIEAARAMKADQLDVSLQALDLSDFSEIDDTLSSVIQNLSIGEVSLPLEGKRLKVIELNDIEKRDYETKYLYTEQEFSDLRDSIIQQAVEKATIKRYE